MKNKLYFLCIILYNLSTQATVLLQKPTSFSTEELNSLIQSWNTHFTWHFKKIASSSFHYKNGNAGFAIKLLSIPLYWKNYTVLPTLQEFTHHILSRPYLFDTPLKYTKSNPTHIHEKELYSFIMNKKCIFYTGAGLSANSNVATMKQLEKSLSMDKGAYHFLKTAWCKPKQMQNAFAAFCVSMINEKPTNAHYTLKTIAEEKSAAILTENLDLLQHRTGVLPIFAGADTLLSIPDTDWQNVDAIICIGLSHDDRGLLAWYKRHNPAGILIAINLTAPNYLSDTDYVCLGDIQTILSPEKYAQYKNSITDN